MGRQRPEERHSEFLMRYPYAVLGQNAKISIRQRAAAAAFSAAYTIDWPVGWRRMGVRRDLKAHTSRNAVAAAIECIEDRQSGLKKLPRGTYF
jgi:hypothetical protein